MPIPILDNLIAGAVGVVSNLVSGVNTVPTNAIQDNAVTAAKVDYNSTLTADGTELGITNPFTTDDESKLDNLGGEGIVISSGTANAVLIGAAPQDITADRRPSQTPRGTFTGDSGDNTRRPFQFHLNSDNGYLTAVMTGRVADYAGDTLQLGDHHIAFNLAQSVDSSISSTNVAEFVWRDDYRGWLVVGANTWAIKEPIVESRLLPKDATNGQYASYNSTTNLWDATNAPTGGGGGLSSVTSDATLTGQGTSSSPLEVANPFTNADEVKLDNLGGEAFITEFSGVATTAMNGNDTEAERRTGETAVGSFTGDSQLRRLHLDGDSGAMTIILTGNIASYTGKTFRVGTRHVRFDDATLSSDINANSQFAWFGDYSDWITVGANQWAVLEPLDPFTQVAIDGNSLTFTTADGNTDTVHLPGRPDPINKLPVPLVPRKLYNLSSADTIDQSMLSQPVSRPQPTQHFATFNRDGFNGVRGYSNQLGNIPANGVVVNFHTTPESPPVSLFFGTALGSQTQYAVSSTIVPGQQNTYLVTGLSYSDLTFGTRFWVNIQFQDGSWLWSPTAVPAGIWVATSAQAVSHAPGYPASWAETGTTEDIPLDNLPQIPKTQLVTPQASWADDGQPEPVTAGVDILASNQAGPGLAVTSSGATAYASAQSASPTFDLDDSDKSHGVVEIAFSLTLSNKSNNTIAFEQAANQDEADDASTERGSDFATITELKATPTYLPSTANGVPIGAPVPIYQGTSTLGNVQVYLTRDANNLLGWHYVYTGEAGNASFNIASMVSVAFQYADPPSTTGGGGRPGMTTDNFTGNADVSIPTNATVNVFGTTYTQIYRYTNSTTATQAVMINATLAGHADWTANGGGDRALGNVRVRVHDSSANTTETILGDLNWYVRNLDINNPDTNTPFEAWIDHWPLSVPFSVELDANDWVQIECRAMTQNTLGGNIVAENTESGIFRTVY